MEDVTNRLRGMFCCLLLSFIAGDDVITVRSLKSVLEHVELVVEVVFEIPALVAGRAEIKTFVKKVTLVFGERMRREIVDHIDLGFAYFGLTSLRCH